MIDTQFSPNCTVLVTHFGFDVVFFFFFFLQFYRWWCKNSLAMDQRKNDSFVPSITQLEDFLTEHDSNVVWLLVGKVNLLFWLNVVFLFALLNVLLHMLAYQYPISYQITSKQ